MITVWRSPPPILVKLNSDTMRILICTALLVANYISYAQRTISGTVLDENNEGIPGASIVIKDLDLGTITNMDGYFELSVPEQQKTLIVSAVGYLTQQVTVGSKSKIVIRMSIEVKELEALTIFGDEYICLLYTSDAADE